MVGNDKTVFDPGATLPESDKTVLESEAGVAGNGTTILEAALSDAAGRMDAPASGRSVQKGGIILDIYRVESDAIEGGMGSVWRVHHTGWNVDLAMKRPQPQCFSSEKSKADFIHECEAWINLGLHPNIVSCYYVREIFGTPSIFSEWMDGGSLESMIHTGSLYEGTQAEQQERILDIAIQFARGLHYAHSRGLIHQDVKPDNVLLTKEGDAKVADFGLARARAVLTVLEGDLTLAENTDSGKTMLSPSGGYTPAYCSMEQMDGKPLTRRTDIYSWAISVMEMYIGSRPWSNGVVAGLSCRDYLENTRLPMRRALKELLVKCVEAEPDDRPHDFSEVEEKLREIYRDETGSDYPRPAPKAAADSADSLNNRALSFLDLGNVKEAEACWERAKIIRVAHMPSSYNHALFMWRNGKIDDLLMLNSCAGLRPGDGMPDIGLLMAAVHLERGDGKKAQSLLVGKEIPPAMQQACLALAGQSLDPRSQTVAFEGYRHVSRLDENGVTTAAPYNQKLISPDAPSKMEIVKAWSHQADQAIVSNTTKQYSLLNLRTGDLRDPFISHEAQINAVAFSPDDSLVASGDQAGTIRIWNVHTLSCITEINKGGYVFALCFDATGRRLYSGGFSGAIHVWDVTTGALLKTLVSSAGEIRKLTLSQDGSRLISGDSHYGQVWDTKSGKCLCTLFEERCDGKVLLSAEGRFAAVTSGHWFSISGNETFSIKRIPESGFYSDYILSKIVGSKRQFAEDDLYNNLAEEALEKLGSGEINEALNLISRARTFTGRETDSLLLDLRAEAARHKKRGSLINVMEKGVIPFENAVFSYMVMTPDSDKLALLSGKSISLYSIVREACLSKVDISISNLAVRACFDKGGKTLFVAASDGAEIFGLDAATGAVFKKFQLSDIGAISGNEHVHELSMSDCGKYLFADTTFAGTIGAWKIEDGKFAGKLSLDTPKTDGVTLSRTGVFSIDEKGGVTSLSRVPASLARVIGSVGCVFDDRHSSFIHPVFGRELRIRSLGENAEPPRIRGDVEFTATCFVPGGMHVITADAGNRVALWTADGAFEREICHTESSGYRMCISPNGRHLAVQMKNGNVRLLELEWALDDPADGDLSAAMPYLANFRVSHPYYSAKELANLITNLQNAGHGWMSESTIMETLLTLKPERMLPGKKPGK